MADGISFSTQPFSIASGATVEMPLDQTIDVMSYDKVDLQLGVLKDEPTSVKLYTSMQRDTEDGWTVVGSFATASSVVPAGWGNVLALPETGMVLLRFLRWEVVMPAAKIGLFVLHGVARRRAL